MGYSGRDIIIRFAKYAGQPWGLEPDGKNGRLRHRFPDGSGASLYYRGDRQGRYTELDSYGSHFPLARLALTPSGKRRLWVLNGDRWSSSGFGRTNQYNEMMREAAQESGTPWVILPFSALREAGIDPDTIHVAQALPERWTLEEHSAATLDEVPEHFRKRRFWTDATGAEITPPVTDSGSGYATPLNGSNGGWYQYTHSRLNGSSREEVPGPAYSPPLDYQAEELTPGPDGRYHWTESRHWLGESVFRATYRRWNTESREDEVLTRYFLSAFDENEPSPLYFLAELPKGARPRTVAEAREALKPKEVTIAEKLPGVTVQRQGDVFAIPRPGITTRNLPGPSRKAELVLGVNHRATEVRNLDGATYARGWLRHDRVPAEHRAIRLGDGKTWHMLVRNTVELYQGQPRAWTIGGGVD